ncbi:MAG: ABC-F family ATP-binding cassette domain-containing protein [Candidatus Gracilibacteria bacterium]
MLQLQNVTISHGVQTFIENVSFSMEGKAKKRIALLGANGTGKSSLLKVLAGIDEPAGGSRSLSREMIGYVPQELVIDEQVKLGDYMETLLVESWMSYRIVIALDEVGLAEDILEKNIGMLSGGEKVRLSIAIALLSEPTILLLDEPTNHLDDQGLLWLGEFLTSFSGSLLMITHDRAFINTYLTELWEIDLQYKVLQKFTGNYDDFLLQKEKLYEIAMRDYKRYQDQIDEAALWLKENEFHPKFRFSDRVMAKKKQLADLLEKRPPEPILRKSVKFLKPLQTSEQRLLKLNIQEKKIGGNIILKDKEIIIRVGDRIRIMGENGSGKTTLLRILAKADKDFTGEYSDGVNLKLAYLEQGVSLPQDKKMLDYVLDTVYGDHTSLRRMLAHYLFNDNQMDQKIGNLSFGEQKRLELAIMLQQKPNLLLMDEPTNHLDIFAREDLEKFLIEEAPSIIVITHDAYFADKIGFTKEIVLEKGR